MHRKMDDLSSPAHMLETWAVPGAIELSSIARWEIDLSPGRTTVPSSRGAERTIRFKRDLRSEAGSSEA